MFICLFIRVCIHHHTIVGVMAVLPGVLTQDTIKYIVKTCKVCTLTLSVVLKRSSHMSHVMSAAKLMLMAWKINFTGILTITVQCVIFGLTFSLILF